MAKIGIRDLRDDLSFGSVVEGASQEMLQNPAIRAELVALFERRGILVFSGVEPSQDMQVAISSVFGPPREPGSKSTPRVDEKRAPGIIDMHYQGHEHDDDPSGLVEIDGKVVARFVPWHFDLCYNDELNRGGALRALASPPEGGRTGFIDGVAAYEAMPRDLRRRIEGHNIVYTLDPRFSQMRFGRNFKEMGDYPAQLAIAEELRTRPRGVHPAVWARATGEKVLHVGVLMSVGIEHREDPEGDALLEELCQWINRSAPAYWHAWQPGDVIVWDNWRMVHSVEGFDPKHERRTQRTTIKGDYGLGYFEGGKRIGAAAALPR